MDQTITLNAKVFNVTSRPNQRTAVLTTRSRGVDLPDTLQVAHRSGKNPVSGLDELHSTSIQRTYLNASSEYKVIQFALTSKIPADADATNVAAALADLTDYMASAITLRSANIAAHENGEVP